jgi:protein-export membrane protein SecD
MASRSKTSFLLFLIVLLALAAGLFVFPKGLGGKILPWHLGLDLVGGSYLVYETDMSAVTAGDRASVLNGLRDVMERRVNVFGVSEPRVTTAKMGESYQLIVELAGIKDVEEAIKQIGRTALLDFREVVQVGEEDSDTLNFKQTKLTGRYLQKSKVSTDPNTKKPLILIDFNEEGGKLFEQLTKKNVGKPLAIFLDNELISMPTVQEPIAGGNAQITGQVTFQELRKLP